MSRLRSARFSRPREIPHAALTGPVDGDEGGLQQQPDFADWSSLTDDELYRVELRQRLVEALTDLPTIYRLPVLLRDVQGLSTEEAAGMLKLKPQTLKSRLHRGRLVLRQQLAEFSSGLVLRRPPA